MSEVKKRLMKRVTIEYYEDWSEVEIEYNPRSERVIKKTTKKEKRSNTTDRSHKVNMGGFRKRKK